MKTKEQIEERLIKLRKIKANYEGCTYGTDGWEVWNNAKITIQWLEWVLAP